MKLLFLLILNSCMLNKGRQETFLDKVTKDFDRYSYYICLKSMNGENYIIENDDFYYYLQNQTGINKEQYQKEVRAKLNDSKTFEIIDPDSNFIKVPKVPRVEANADKGVDEFIKIYFDNGRTLKDDVTDDERTVIIQKLFDWKIGSKIDDETGYLVISP